MTSEEKTNVPRVETSEERQARIKEQNRKKLAPYVLKPDNLCTAEEIARKKRIASMGGKARQESINRKRNMQDVIQGIMNSTLSKQDATRIVGEDALKYIPDGDISMMAVLALRTMQEAAEGNHKALETIANLGGYSPKQQVEITADVTTDADRELLENVQKRLEA